LSVIIEWTFALLVIVGLTYAYTAYARARCRANEAILSALDSMEKKWDVLVEAGDDVPEEVLELCYFMVKVAKNPNSSWALYISLHSRSLKSPDLNGEIAMLARSMRDPLQGVLDDFFGAWYVVVANRNLLMRAAIRTALGRIAEQSGAINPKSKGAFSAANRVKDRQHKNGACA